MSRMTDVLTSKLPENFTIPEPLERAWSWMEQQGWGRGDGNGYVLTPYAGELQRGVVFLADQTLDGWFEPDEPGFERMVPLAEISGDGGVGVAWRDDDGEVRFGGFGAFGPFLLANNAVDFLRLIAIGHIELNSMLRTLEPEEEESVAAHAEFRAWVSSEFDVEVPATWTQADPDPFAAWYERVKSDIV